MAATRRLEALDGGHSPRLVLWPEDVVALDEPLVPVVGGVGALRTREEAAHHARGRRDRDRLDDRLPQRDRRVGTGRHARLPLREGPSGPLRRVRALPQLLLPPREPLGRAARRDPGHRYRPHGDPGRAARGDGLLRGLLRGPRSLLGAGRRRAPHRAHQHRVVRHQPGAHPGVRRGDDPSRPARTGSPAGVAHRVQRRHRPPRRARGALGDRRAPGGVRDARPADRDHPLRALRRPTGPRPRRGGPGRRLVARRRGAAAVAVRRRPRGGDGSSLPTRSSPSGCRRRECPPRGTWRSCGDRPRTRGAARSRTPATRRPCRA